MQDRIKQALQQIEQQNNVKIFYACESGSRAWGFPSEDSDYDVRFLYARQRDWYLSIDLELSPDVIERPITDDLDVSGWDIRKALQLLRKSNPPLLEWLNSPVVYRESTEIIELLRSLTAEFYSPSACGHHYLHMAQGNYREYLRNDPVWIKKYFYVLRPLLAIKWIEERNSVVPVEFETLVATLLRDDGLLTAIRDLIEKKKLGNELDRGPKIPLISEYIELELNRLGPEIARLQPRPSSIEKLNEAFRFILKTIW